MSIHGRDGEEPSKPIPETLVFGPLRPRETEEKDDGVEESWQTPEKKDVICLARWWMKEPGNDPTGD